MVIFMFKVMSSSAISDLEFSFPEGNNNGVKASVNAVLKIDGKVNGGGIQQHNVVLDLTGSFTQPVKMSGDLSYKIVGSQNVLKLSFSGLIPVSAFVGGIKINKDGFVGLLKDAGPFKLASFDLLKLPGNATNFIQSLPTLAALLRLEVAFSDEKQGIAALYGRTVAGHHILLYVKNVGDKKDCIHGDFKCNEGQVASSLSLEVIAAFGK
jgi:hypothetical protein